MTKIGNTLIIVDMNLPYIINLIFLTYNVLIFLRIISSWFPAWQAHTFVRFVAFYTDPYLHFFRRIIPPLGGVLDLSPILAIFALNILERIIMGLVR